ncbi:MAG: hypothetical protein A2748_03815 [Candidatus Wildermuthbacteria bacterium RIFCSPHIGHO2_01_FULL_45_20]|nr:MAG: hypothetical protein A2748_03815 [Candidatus Wildermuthbacteria bacterium RIFCSPHIGHO2_01_FULL_45_20]
MRIFSIILKYIKPYRKTLVFLGALSVVSAFANAIVPWLAGSLIDSLIHASRAFFVTIGFWIAAKTVADIVDWKIGVKSEWLGALLHADYLSGSLGKMLEFPMKFHKQTKTGEVFDRINTASEQISQIMSRIVVDLAPQFLSILLALGFIFFINIEMGAVVLISLLLYTFILARSTPTLTKLFKRVYRSSNRAYGEAYDIVDNVGIVKQASAEKIEQERLRKNFRMRTASLEIRIATLWQNLSFWQKVIISATQLLIFLYSFHLVSQGTLTVGQIVAVNAYTTLIFGPFVILARNWHVIQNGITSLALAEELLETPAENYHPTKALYLKRVKGKLEFRNVSFSYDEDQAPALHDINFIANPGQKIALVGRSGQGKSTLVDLISLYYRPTRGSILIDGRDTRRIHLDNLRSQIAIVPQEIVLFNDTILNNIRYGNPKANMQQVINACKLAHADEFIERFSYKYKQRVGEKGVKLSVGQKQRLALARAILRNPRILILDEPTSALDAQLEQLIQESLNTLMQGRTTFIIAHRLSTVREADRIMVLEGGRIAESGSHEQLIAKEQGIYRNLYEIQFGITA